MKPVFFLWCVLGAALAGVAASPALAVEKIPLDYRAYDGWNAIRATVLSEDGAWLAYALVPQDADGAVVVRNVASGHEFRGARGVDHVRFSEDARFVFYRFAPPAADVFTAKRAKKKPDQMPKYGFGLIALSTGTEARVERVKSYAIAKHGSNWVAYLLEAASPSPKPSPSAAAATSPSPNPGASASASSSPSPSPSPTPESKKVEDGTTLVLRDLRTGTTRNFEYVSEYAISDDEKYLAYLSQSADGKHDGAYVLALGTAGDPQPLLAGAGHFAKIAFARERDTLAFLSDTESYAGAAPQYQAYLWSAGDASARSVVRAGTSGMPAGDAPSAEGTVAFAYDGSRLFLGVAPAPTPRATTTPEPMQVDLWNWHDALLQSEQRVEAEETAKRTYTGALDLASGRYVQLGDPRMYQVDVNRNDAYALGRDVSTYYRQRSWDGFYQDDYIVSLQDGSRRLAGRRVAEDCTLSPAGKYAVCYDSAERGWYTVRSSDGRRAELTRHLGVAFYDELDDHPAPPPSYGLTGWTAGDARVLISDRYDIWAFDPNGGNAQRVTGGYGRAHRIRLDYVPMDPETPSIDPNAAFFMLGKDERTKAMGVYRLPNASPGQPRQVLLANKQLEAPLKAKRAQTYVLSEERFDEPPNLWLGSAFDALTRVSDANPQFSKYRWGTAHLIHYVAEGKHLDGILYLPDGFDRRKKHPMLVYFYERFSDDLNYFYPPAPGTSPNFPRYVSNGYALLIPDVAYTTGHPGRNALDAVGAAIDAAVKEGGIDTSRIGVAGHSWGAYQIAYMITRTHRFAAAEAGAAVADMISAYGGIRWGTGLVREFQYEHGQSRMGATPWERPDLYIDNSALFRVEDVTTPYLTIANDADDAVPWYQGIEFFTALRRLNKEAYLFVFNGEFHNLRGREQQKYWTVHLDEYFDHFLKGAPAPPWMTHGVDYLHRGERNVRPLFGETP
jgi:dipeptidyl aminopeptidase/acylaminoacyl peptidase